MRPVNENDIDPVRSLGTRDKGAEYAPFSFRQIIEFIFLLPLTFVPYVGIPLFLFGTGYRAGPLLSWRYFKLKGFDKKQRNAFIKNKSRKWQYTWFGTVALLLQLIPVLSVFCLFSTAVGSALLAANMEQARSEEQRTAQDTEEELPPPYEDEV